MFEFLTMPKPRDGEGKIVELYAERIWHDVWKTIAELLFFAFICLWAWALGRRGARAELDNLVDNKVSVAVSGLNVRMSHVEAQERADAAKLERITTKQQYQTAPVPMGEK